jgi:hypothetical protein
MQWPIDTNKLTLLYANHEPVIDFDTKAPVHDKDTGYPVFRVNLMRFAADQRAEALSVKVVGEPKGLVPTQQVRCEGLTVQFWEVKDKAGIAFKADAITPVAATTAKAAA